MPGTFKLELTPGQDVTLSTTIKSNKLDMARMEGNILVDGTFLGKLDIVHSGDTHIMEFSGTCLPPGQEYNPDMFTDTHLTTKYAIVAKPATAKCHLTVLSPIVQFCNVVLKISPLWKLGVAWPLPEHDLDNTSGSSTVKYFLQIHPGGVLEHLGSRVVSSALYYEVV